MNREVEERIVAMYFDNEDFEKNAKTTIDTLGQLKEGLNLEESAKGFNVFEKLGKTLNFEKASANLSKVKNGISSIKNTFKNAFKIGQEPLHEAEGLFKQLNGYITKYIGFDVAGKIVNSIKNAVRSLTIQPITAGWNQYESTMDSVKTIMSSTGESIDTVTMHLQNMTEYANKTIYSLTDMTSNLGKFTNNGVELERSVTAMEGIANATADAGQGAQQASMAMYNISQAIGVGKMTTIDWKSLENANIATQKLKKTFLEMAALQGRIEKQTNGAGMVTYMLTKDENGEKLKEAVELTTANFREYLSKGWLDKETMLRAFEVYSGVIDENTLESWGIHDEETKKYFMQLGQEALEAATQVRTFSKMMDALKESAQSGWARSFELIFGNMEQGTTLWTTINEELDSILSKSAEARNEILRIWAGSSVSTEKEEKRIQEIIGELEKLQLYYAELQNSKQTNQTKEKLAETKKQIEAYEKELENLNKLIGDKERERAQDMRDEKGRSGRDILIDALLGTKNENEERVGGLMQLLRTIGSTFKDAFGEVFGTIDAEGLFALSQKIENAVHNISNWFLEIDKTSGLSRLDKLKNILKGLLGPIKAIFTIIKALWSLVKRIATPIIDFFIDAFNSVSGFFESLGNMSIPEMIEAIGNGIKTAWEKIKKFFTPKELYDDKGFSIGKEIPFITWLKNVWSGLKKIVKKWMEDNGLGGAWATISGWWNTLKETFNEGKNKVVEIYNNFQKWWKSSGVEKFFSDIWNTVSGLFKPEVIKYDDRGFELNEPIIKDAPIVQFFEGIYTGLTKWVEEIRKWWNDSKIGDFFAGIWEAIASQFKTSEVEITGKQGYSWTETREAPIVTFLDEIWGKVTDVWDSIVGWSGWTDIGNFLGDVWKWIEDKAKVTINWFTQPDDKNGGKTGFAKFLSDAQATISSVWESIVGWSGWTDIGNFLGDVWKWIEDKANVAINWFTQPDDKNGGKTGFAKFLSDAQATISSVWESVIGWSGWTDIGNFLGDVWTWIEDKANVAINWFTQPDDKNGGKTGFAKFLSDAQATISSVWDSIVAWKGWEEIGKFLGDIWKWIEDKANVVINWFTQPDDKNGGKTGFAKFLLDVKSTIEGAWTDIVSWEGWQKIGEFLNDTWKWVMDLVGLGSSNEGSTSASSRVESRYSAALKSVDTIIKSDVGMGASEKDAQKAEEKVSIFQRIVDALTNFFTSIGNAASEIAKSPMLNDFLKALGDFFAMLTHLMTEALKLATRIGTGQGSATDIAGVISLGLGYILTKIYDLMHTKHLAEITTSSQSFGLQFLEIAAGIALVSAAIIAISNVDTGKLLLASGVVLIIGGVIATVIGVLSKLTQAGTAKTLAANAAKTPETGMERIGKNLKSCQILFRQLRMLRKISVTLISAKM